MTATKMAATNEILAGARFGFGENWAKFLRLLSEERIRAAEKSLQDYLGVASLAGRSFLDIGSGSGLFSLAARRLGARVYSFDYDPQSVACTAELKRRYYPDDREWTVASGSVLDREFLAGLGRFDIVYSWGVLHHTGAMWEALENAVALVNPQGVFFIALYNDQGRTSRLWTWIKRAYCRLPGVAKWLVLGPVFIRLWGPRTVIDLCRLQPFATWRNYGKGQTGRGMSPWRDVVDWVGGYPFEVSKPEEIFDFLRQHGFELRRLKTCGGGLGCNEYVAQRRRDVVKCAT